MLNALRKTKSMEPEQEALYTVFFKDREANSVNKLNPNFLLHFRLNQHILIPIYTK